MAARNVDREEKAAQIIRHAMVVFARKGYNATKIDDIAVRAKIGKGTVYEYFKSKQDLFFAVFNTYMERYFETLQEGTPEAGMTAARKMREVTRAAFELIREDEEILTLTFEFWSASSSSEDRERIAGLFRHMYGVFRGFFAGLIREGIDNGEFSGDADADSVAAVAVGSFDGLFLQAWFDKELDVEKAASAYMDVLIGGLRAPAASDKTFQAGGGNA